MKVKLLSRVRLCDPVDCSPPGSSVHGILQARVLEWVAISFSRGSSQPRIKPGSPEWQADSLPTELSGKPSDLGSIPGLGRSPGEGKGYPLQYSGLENSMDYNI